jgi:hypothetical protein
MDRNPLISSSSLKIRCELTLDHLSNTDLDVEVSAADGAVKPEVYMVSGEISYDSVT